MTNKCKYCNEDITWGEYKAGQPSRPFSLDGTIHSCTNGLRSNDQSQTTPEPKTKTPKSSTQNTITSESILAEIEAFRIKFGPVESDARFESMAKMWISRMISKG